MLYSHSRLSTFEQCPYKYRLKYINKIDPIIEDTIETFLGSNVHITLEKLYLEIQKGHTITLNNLLSFYYQKWYEKWNDKILIVKKGQSMEHYLTRGCQYISDYYHRYKPFTNAQTIAVEDQITVSLDEDNTYQLHGFIDRLSETKAGHYEIHDYKTSSRLPHQNQIDRDRQLAIYALGVKQKYPNVKDISLVWHYLKFNKELRSKRSPKQLSKLKTSIISMIDTIENTKTYPRKPSVLCHWCSYKPICPQYSHLYQIKEHRENRYNRKTGKQLVDKYIKLKQQTRQTKLDSFLELKHLKQSILHYAAREHLDVMYGTNSKIQIIRKKQISIPKKETKQYKELIEILKENNKYEIINRLDAETLYNIIKNKKWEKELLNKISLFLSVETKKDLLITTS